MTNKEKVKQFFLENPQEPFTAEHISAYLHMKRNAASALLNELSRNGVLQKNKTRPVLFSYGNKLPDPAKAEWNPFVNFTGYDGSMKSEIDQCRIVSTYPGRGIPLMILGESGVGKSMLARYIYNYSKYKHIIPSNAPFVTLNCADYSDNKELLSAALFGYKKGAFTGADKDTVGLIESANQGYLFLDEVHRLSEEGQEKLFRYMDYGVISRMGSGREERPLNVRLIFATTEDVTALMLDTFLRRIPLTVRIKSFHERNYQERLQIVYKLFYEECCTLNQELKVRKELVNYLTSFCGNGNIGTLKNIIKISCAAAYGKSNGNKDSVIPVEMRDCIGTAFTDSLHIRENFNELWLPVQKGQPELSLPQAASLRHEAAPCWQKVEEALEQYEHNLLNKKALKRVLSLEMTAVTDSFNDISDQELFVRLKRRSAELACSYIQENYGVDFGAASINTLVRIFLLLKNSAGTVVELENIKSLMRSCMPKACNVGRAFCRQMARYLEPDQHEEEIYMICSLYFYLLMEDEEDYCNAVIVTHGKAVASGIAGWINHIFNRYIFDAIDMPYDMSEDEVTKKVRSYLRNADTNRGVLLFVDMGALTDLKNDVRDLVKGDLGIISQVSMPMAIEAGTWILKKAPADEILRRAASVNLMKYDFIPKREKTFAIVVCCVSGIGSAVKIGEMFKECIDSSMNIEVKPYEYADLKTQGGTSTIFQKHRVLFIVSTVELEIENENILLLTELVSEHGQSFLYHAMEPYFPLKAIRRFINGIVKAFSMRNIINQLVILNPERIIEDVDSQLTSMEQLMGAEFPIHIKEMLFIHTSIMIERLIMDPPYMSTEIDRTFEETHKSFIKLLKKSFSVIEEKYNVSINIRECRLIYDIIAYKQGLLKDF